MADEKRPAEPTQERETGALTGSREFRKGSNVLPDLNLGPMDSAPSALLGVPVDPVEPPSAPVDDGSTE